MQTEDAEIDAVHDCIHRATRWTSWVAMMLREAEATQPTLRELTELRSVSPRTLTPHLANGEGVRLPRRQD